jgi:hypothetical protein
MARDSMVSNAGRAERPIAERTVLWHTVNTPPVV